MTTKVIIINYEGNKQVSVELNINYAQQSVKNINPGEMVEYLLHDNRELRIREIGDFI